MTSLRLRLLNAVLRGAVKPKLARTVGPADARADLERAARLFFRTPPGTAFVPSGWMPGAWIWNGPFRRDAAVLYLHGGGYIAGSPRTHRGMLGRLARKSGLQVFAPDYRLAPEHPFPAALDDALAAWDGLLARGYAPERIAIAGDSAGGGLALALLSVLCRRGTPPAAAAAISPWTDLTLGGASMTANADADALLPAIRIEEVRDFYLAGRDPRDPRASPLFADFPSVCPILFQVGSEEILRDDTLRLAARLQAEGAQVEVADLGPAPHVVHIFDGYAPEARAATTQVAAFLSRFMPPA